MLNFLGNILGYVMRFIYDTISQIGTEPENFSYFAMSIIVATLFIKLITLPLNLKAARQMKKTQELQPQAKEIQIKFKHDPQTANIKIQQLYRENGASMTGGCLPILIQMPVILAFFRVMQNPGLYVFNQPGHFESISKTFLWIKDLTLADPHWYGLPLLVGLTTFLQSFTTPKVGTPEQQEQMASMNTMNYIMPIMFFWFALKYPGGLALYWITNTLFTAIQQLITNRAIIFKKKGE